MYHCHFDSHHLICFQPELPELKLAHLLAVARFLLLRPPDVFLPFENQIAVLVWLTDLYLYGGRAKHMG